VRRTNIGRWYNLPFRVIPDLGQVANDLRESPDSNCPDIFHDRKPWSYDANEPVELCPQTGSCSGESGWRPLRRSGIANVLTGKSSANKVNCSELVTLHLAYICHALYVRPVFRQYAAAVVVYFHLPGADHPGAVEAEIEAADARK